MKHLRRAAIEFVTIGVLGIIVAFSANAVRVKGNIKPSKNYFDTGTELLRERGLSFDKNGIASRPTPTSPAPDTPAIVAPTQHPGTNAAQPAANGSEREQHLKHPYQEIDFEGVMEVVKDPNTASGLNVIVDARKDELFEEGHIPGAVVCNPHEIDLYLDTIRSAVMGADKVIVYCGGGDCEDSVAMCRELIDMHVPYEAVHVYAGGWKDWSARGAPADTGKN